MNRSPLQRLHLPPLKIAGNHRGSENTAGSRCCWGFFADQWAHLCWKPSIGRSCRIDRAAVVQPPSATLALLSVAPCSQGRARLPKRRLFLLHCESMAAAWHRLSLKSSVSPAARRRTQGCYCLARRHLHKHCVSGPADITETLAEVERARPHHANADAQTATCDSFFCFLKWNPANFSRP